MIGNEKAFKVQSLVKSMPELLLSDAEEIEEKIGYIGTHMLLEGEDVSGCRKLAALTLNDIMDRHEFLIKTGSYKTPDPKRPQIKMVCVFLMCSKIFSSIIEKAINQNALRITAL